MGCRPSSARTPASAPLSAAVRHTSGPQGTPGPCGSICQARPAAAPPPPPPPPRCARRPAGHGTGAWPQAATATDTGRYSPSPAATADQPRSRPGAAGPDEADPLSDGEGLGPVLGETEGDADGD